MLTCRQVQTKCFHDGMANLLVHRNVTSIVAFRRWSRLPHHGGEAAQTWTRGSSTEMCAESW